MWIDQLFYLCAIPNIAVRVTLENKIRFKAVIIYLLLTVICGLLIFFAFYLRLNIGAQKESIAEQYDHFSRTEEVIATISQAQTEANLYIATRRQSYLDNFNATCGRLKSQTDSLIYDDIYPENDSLLSAINIMLAEKGNIATELGKQLQSSRPIEAMSVRLQSLEPALQKDTVMVRTTTTRDTLINITSQQPSAPAKTSKKRRKKREAEPVPVTDTIMSIKTSAVVDTLSYDSDKRMIVSEVSDIAQQASLDYTKHMGAIGKNITRLVLADQEISLKINEMVTQLHSKTVHASFKNVQKTEEKLQKMNTFSILGGVAALILAMAFIILIINDVNKGRRAREELEIANKRTREIMESRHQLLLSVSHDVKTPLNSILGYLEMAAGGKNLSAQDISAMQAAGGHITALLENLLEFSSLEQGRQYLSCRGFSLSGLCLETAEIFTPLAARKGLEFETSFDFDPELCLFSDPLKIKQIAINVLSNAVKYTSEGKITFGVAYRDGRITMDITDTGAGIPTGQIEKIYRPFERVEENIALAEGSGLGMYVVKGMTELLEGGIEIESEVGKGTHVTVCVPATEAERTATGKRTGRIVIVDDDTSLLAVLREMCERAGHKCHVCDSMEHLMQLAEDIPEIDMVITDMEMGSLSGTDILHFIKERNASIPVIVSTGRSDMTASKAAETGFDGFLSKPITIYDLSGLFDNTKARHPASGDCGTGRTQLEELLGGDKEAMAEIIGIFIGETEGNTGKLKTHISSGDFASAKQVCHKMLPMFRQLDADRSFISILERMERSKAHRNFPTWKNELRRFIEYTGGFIEELRRG